MLNVVALIGRMVADPELKYTPSGVAVCSFTIAVDRRFKNEAGERQTDFFDIVAWRQSAEFAANYLSKGRLVAVQGRLQQRSWVQQDGQKRSRIEVIADSLQGLDRPRDSQPQGSVHSEPDYTQAEPIASIETDMDYDPFADE